MSYLCANFSLPRPLCSRLRPDVCDRRQTDVRPTPDVRQKHRLIPPPIRCRGIIRQTVTATILKIVFRLKTRRYIVCLMQNLEKRSRITPRNRSCDLLANLKNPRWQMAAILRKVISISQSRIICRAFSNAKFS